MISPWWMDRAKNGIVYVLASVLVVAILGFTFYKVFIQRNITQKTNVENGGVVNHYYDNATIKSTFGCQSLGAMKHLKELKEGR
jgi:hypothetical protein